MKYLESPWAIVILALGFVSMVEVLHINAHYNCAADCPCHGKLSEEY